MSLLLRPAQAPAGPGFNFIYMSDMGQGFDVYTYNVQIDSRTNLLIMASYNQSSQTTEIYHNINGQYFGQIGQVQTSAQVWTLLWFPGPFSWAGQVVTVNLYSPGQHWNGMAQYQVNDPSQIAAGTPASWVFQGNQPMYAPYTAAQAAGIVANGNQFSFAYPPLINRGIDGTTYQWAYFDSNDLIVPAGTYELVGGVVNDQYTRAAVAVGIYGAGIGDPLGTK